ncbi:MAG: hypothetical protein AB1696_13795 [Planctomycetota bacterium]
MNRYRNLWIHRPLKRRLDLRVEELEHRVAPATLTTGQWGQFTDADGDEIRVEFWGRGSVTYLSGGVDPAGTNITHIDLFNTDSSSRLIIRDLAAGDGNDDLTVGEVASMGAAALGVLDLNSPRVYNTNITMNNVLSQMYIRGMMDNVVLTGNTTVKNVAVEGLMDNGSALNVNGDLTSFTALGMDNGSSLNIGGRLGNARITGDMNNGSAILSRSQLGFVAISGDVLSSAIQSFAGSSLIRIIGDMDNSLIDVGGGKTGQIYVLGEVRNASQIVAMRGTVSMVSVGSNFSDSVLSLTSSLVNSVRISGSVLGTSVLQPVVGGTCRTFSIGGNVIGADAGNPVQFNVQNGILGSMTIGGYVQWTAITSQAVDQMGLTIRGNLTESTVNLSQGTMGFFEVGGSAHTNVVIASNQETIRSLAVRGSLYGNSAITVANGSIYRLDITGDVYGASQVFNGTNSTSNTISVGGNMYGGAAIIGTNTTFRGVSIRGYMDEAASIQVTDGDIFSITVGPGMFNGANILATRGSLFNVAVRGAMDSLTLASPFIRIVGGGALGGVSISGHMFDAQLDALVADYGIRMMIGGDIVDSTINIVGGTLDSFYSRGNFINSTFTMDGGEIGMFRMMGNMENSAFTMPAWVRMISVGGHIQDSTWAINGGSQMVMINGYVDNSGLAPGSGLTWAGRADLLQILGYVADAALTAGGGFGSLRIGGYVDTATIASQGTAGQWSVMGDVTNSVLQIIGSAASLRVGGNMTNSDIAVIGTLDSLFIMGGIVDTDASVFVFGETGSASVRGVVNTGQLVFQRHVGRLSIGGLWSGAVTVADGGVGNFMVGGDIDNTSAINVTGASGFAMFLGDVLSASAVNFNNGLNSLMISGMVTDSTINVLNGSDGMAMIAVRAGMWGTSTITVQGDCSVGQVQGGINDTTALNISGYVRSLSISGNIAQDAIVTVGSTVVSGSGAPPYYTGTLDMMNVGGVIYGRVQILGTLNRIDSAGSSATPTAPSGAPFTGAYRTKDAAGNPTIQGRVDYVAIRPGGSVDGTPPA